MSAKAIRVSPIEEEPEDAPTSPSPPTITPHHPPIDSLTLQSHLPADSQPTTAAPNRCNICQRNPLKRNSPCLPHFHIIVHDFKHRQHLIIPSLALNASVTLDWYISMNIDKDEKRRLTNDSHKIPAQVTLENLRVVDYFASANSAGDKLEIQTMGRTTDNNLYYPFILDEHLNTFVLNFNKPRSMQEAIQFHHWTNTSPAWLSPFTARIKNATWKEIKLITFNQWLKIPALMDTAGEIYTDANLLEHLAKEREITLPTELPSLLTANYTEYASYWGRRTMQSLYQEWFPDLWSPGDPIGPLIPLPAFARGVEILECLIASKLGIQLYTPITGTILMLRKIIPFIMIAGKIHIPFSVVKLIIPHPPPAQNDLLITQALPIQLYNWLSAHLATAALVSKFPLDANPVIPIKSLLQVEGIKLHWMHRRTRTDAARLVSELTA